MFKGIVFFIKNGWKYDKRYVIWNVLYQLLNSFIPPITALIPKLIIDELIINVSANKPYLYVILLLGSLLLIQILSVYFHKDGFSRRCQVGAEFDSALHQTLYTCDYGNLERPDFLELQEKSKKFLYSNWHGFGYLLDCALSILGHGITLLGLCAMISTLNIWIIILFLALSVAGASYESRIQKKIKQMEDTVIDDQRRWTYFSSLFEKAELGRELRIYRAGEWLLRKEREFFTRANHILCKQNNEYIKSGSITAIITFIEQLAAYGYLIYNAANGKISLGSFMMYISAITSFSLAIQHIINAIVEIKAYDMYYDNLESYINIPSMMRTGTKEIPLNCTHTIEFRNVSFQYPGSEYFVLKNVSISLQSGEKLLIVGENGAGKSTFIKLMMRLYDPTEGSILLDGINIKEFDYESYLSLFSTVFQDYHLFSFSLRENITMSETYDDDQILQILNRVGLADKMRHANVTLNTEIHKNFSESGFEPSGGEGQRIAIARALFKNAPIMVLDEPTAALDPRAEYDIYKQFQDMVAGKTAVYISHRLSSSKFCDKIAVFENGCITEYGSHEELLNRSGKYAELFNMQAAFYSTQN